MQSRRIEKPSIFHQIADSHPFLFLPFHMMNGKFTIQKPSVKAKSIFQNQEYSINGELLAQLKHYDDFPVIEIYTRNATLKAKAQANLTAQYMMQFYLQYVQYLPLVARLRSGKLMTEPMRFVNDEINRRQLDLSYINVELHYLLIELNACVAKYNQSINTALQLNYFTINELKAVIVLTDVYKGIGCSAAVLTEKNNDDNYAYTLIRNLDWTSLNVLGNNTLSVLSLTNHEDPTKPQAVFSISFTPGIFGLSMANDKGLVITINEATKMNNKRENKSDHAVPQFILIRQIVENCSTVAEVKQYIAKVQPATSHILTVMDAEGGSGVFEMLPNKGPYSNRIYRFRGYDPAHNEDFSNIRKAKYIFSQHVTNHFVNEYHEPIPGTEGSDCSFKRFTNMEKAIQNGDSAFDIAKSTSVDDTVQTIIFSRNKNQLTVDINFANSYSAQALDKNHQAQIHYSHIDLSEKFQHILSSSKNKLDLNHLAFAQTTTSIDKQLIQLMRLIPQVGKYSQDLAHDLNCIYSSLCFNLSKCQAGVTQGDNLSDSQISNAIILIIAVVKRIYSNSSLTEKHCFIKTFEEEMQKIIPVNHHDYVTMAKNLIPGFVAGALFSTLMSSLYEGSVSFALSINPIAILTFITGGVSGAFMCKYQLEQSGLRLFSRPISTSLVSAAKKINPEECSEETKVFFQDGL